MRDDVLGWDNNSLIRSLTMPSLSEDFLPPGTNQNDRNNNSGSSSSNNRNPSTPADMLPLWDFTNPWLDGNDFFEPLYPPGNILNPPEIPNEPGGQARTEPVTPPTINSGLITHSIINDVVGYGLEMPSYNPLSD
jgi:hypothetical protein